MIVGEDCDGCGDCWWRLWQSFFPVKLFPFLTTNWNLLRLRLVFTDSGVSRTEGLSRTFRSDVFLSTHCKLKMIGWFHCQLLVMWAVVLLSGLIQWYFLQRGTRSLDVLLHAVYLIGKQTWRTWNGCSLMASWRLSVLTCITGVPEHKRIRNKMS